MGPRWRYLIGELGVGLRRNLLMTVATILTVAVSLTIIGAGFLMNKQVALARDLFYAQVEVSIFLDEGIPEAQRVSLQSDLSQNPVVDEVIYESKEQAYEHFKEIFANDPNLLEAVTPEVLPASFRVKLVDPEQFPVIQSQYANYPGVDEVTDQREVLDKVFRILHAFRDAALALGVIQVIIAAGLVFNTIRITAFARREQTGIMKLVGATNWYIQLPFLLEGVVAGVVGAAGATVLLLLSKVLVIDRLRTQIFFFPFIGTEHVLRLVPLLVVIGVGIAAISSFVALRRFLDV